VLVVAVAVAVAVGTTTISDVAVLGGWCRTGFGGHLLSVVLSVAAPGRWGAVQPNDAVAGSL
jgi:hypothetical protein